MRCEDGIGEDEIMNGEEEGTHRSEYPGSALNLSGTLIPLYDTRVRTSSISGECFVSSGVKIVGGVDDNPFWSTEGGESRPASSLVAGGSKTSSICLFETCSRCSFGPTNGSFVRG